MENNFLRYFAFALDGKTDAQSINPLEMTHFEMYATIAAVTAVAVTLLWDLYTKRRGFGLDRSQEIRFVVEPLDKDSEDSSAS